MKQDVDAKLDYSIDWQQLLSEAETIETAVWEVPPDLVGSGQTNDGRFTRIWLQSRNKLPGRFRVSCLATSSTGRVSRQSFELTVEVQ